MTYRDVYLYIIANNLYKFQNSGTSNILLT